MSNINLVARGRIPSVHCITTALVFHLSYIDLYVHGDVFRGDGSSFSYCITDSLVLQPRCQ